MTDTQNTRMLKGYLPYTTKTILVGIGRFGHKGVGGLGLF